MKIATLLTYCMTSLTFLGSTVPVTAGSIPVDLSQKAKPATIKILISRQVTQALLEVKGRYQVYNPDDNILITSSSSSKCDLLLPDQSGLKWGENFPAIYQMRIVPGDSQTTMLVNGTQYRGCLEIYNINGHLNIVNEIDVESYLKSILSCQFAQEKNSEVLEALAIVARTNAYYWIGRNPSSFWHVDAKESDYQGYGVTFQNLHLERAIERSKHMVLTYKNTPFAASWTKNSAGTTADFSTIFRKKALVPSGVNAPLAAQDREKHAWSFSMTKAHLAKLLESSGISTLDLYLDKNSNKVYGLKLTYGQETKNISFLTLQKALGNQKLRSNDFTIDTKGESLIFKGYGEGPGVGLCLYSANKMAEKGERAPKILAAFFPETKLENIRSFPIASENQLQEHSQVEVH